ncbi:uncharacterized protein LOC127728605 isoform X1 [Mytilus californianus]|uniref:uncharacterized protein LOC127728605 isoform X1 n=1 Tax=Mytilus californianus TaxID=6549 RepID=UPI0022461877|nr:uncharacterized protein LOC127728605 isoform X1 [Mytilus californianus]
MENLISSFQRLFILLHILKEICANNIHLQLFEPTIIANPFREVSYVLQKTDDDAVFLIETIPAKEPCKTSGNFRFYEGSGKTGILRYEHGCMAEVKTWVADSNTVSMDVNKPAFSVWTLLAKDQSQGACLGDPVNLLAERREKFITTATFPRQYPAQVNCTWNITSQNNRNIALTVYYLDVEVGPEWNCVFDYIKIQSDGKDEYLCGENIWDKETFHGSHFLVDFISDKSGVRNGFLIGFHELQIIHDDL